MTHVESPLERATTDLTAAITSLEEIDSTLTGDQLKEALDIRERLERLRERVQGG